MSITLRNLHTDTTHTFGSTFRIGRSSSCEVMLFMPTVSRTHAMVTKHRGEWSLRDCNSMNGTLLNGRTLRPGVETILVTGDVVTIDRIDFEVEVSNVGGSALTSLHESQVMQIAAD